MFTGPCIIAIVDKWKTNLMSLAILFHLLRAQHVSDTNIPIFRSLRLCWWITTSVFLFSVQPAKRTPPNTNRNKSSNTQRTENKKTDMVIHQHSRKLLKMDILVSETCWAHNKWNKIASDIKLVFHLSTICTDVHLIFVILNIQEDDIRQNKVFRYSVTQTVPHSVIISCHHTSGSWMPTIVPKFSAEMKWFYEKLFDIQNCVHYALRVTIYVWIAVTSPSI